MNNFGYLDNVGRNVKILAFIGSKGLVSKTKAWVCYLLFFMAVESSGVIVVIVVIYGNSAW